MGVKVLINTFTGSTLNYIKDKETISQLGTAHSSKQDPVVRAVARRAPSSGSDFPPTTEAGD